MQNTTQAELHVIYSFSKASHRNWNQKYLAIESLQISMKVMRFLGIKPRKAHFHLSLTDRYLPLPFECNNSL